MYRTINHHEAIIDINVWNKAQEIYQKRSKASQPEGHTHCDKYSLRYAFSSKIYCAFCGFNYVRRSCKRKNGDGKLIYWACSNRVSSGAVCISRSIRDDYLKELFVEVYNRLISKYKVNNEKFLKVIKEVTNSCNYDKDLEKIINDEQNIRNRLSNLLDLKIDNYIDKETYILKQESSFPGYEKSKDVRIVVDEEVKNKTYITLLNQEFKVYLKVHKVDEIGNNLSIPNIKFKIYDILNEEYVCQKITYPEVKEVCEFTTLKNGTFITPMGLKVSKYRLEEISGTNPGYLWNNDGLEFEITEDGQYKTDKDLGLVLELNFINEKINGKLEFYKLDKETKKPLAGAVIDIFKEDGSFYKSLTTDEFGRIYLENLAYGKYYLEEHFAPDGYIINEEKIWFDIVNNDVVQLMMEDEIINIPNTFLNEYNYLNYGLLLILIGLFVYEKKYC